MTLDEFKKKHKIKSKRESNLLKFKDEILKLHNENVTLVNIQLFLKENSITTSFQNISRFIQSLKSEPKEKKEELVKKTIDVKEPIKKEVVKTTKNNEVKKETSAEKKSIFEESNVESINADIKDAKLDFPELFD
ncbi:MAG: hypothetical protein AB7D96_07630 [Arcobacteraceae bacterium]